MKCRIRYIQLLILILAIPVATHVFFSCSDRHRRQIESYKSFNRGVRAAKSDNLDLAGFYFLKSVNLYPEFTEARLNLANIYFLNGDLDSARDEYGKLLEMNCKDPRIWFNLGWIYLAQDDRETAYNFFTKSHSQSPEFFDADYGLALVARANGEDILTKFHLESYLDNDPNGRWAEKAYEILSSIASIETPAVTQITDKPTKITVTEAETEPETLKTEDTPVELNVKPADDPVKDETQKSEKISEAQIPKITGTETKTENTEKKSVEDKPIRKKPALQDKTVDQLINEGLAALNKGNLTIAEKRLKAAIERDKNSIKSAKGLARLYYIKIEKSNESKYVKTIVRLRGGDPGNYFELAEVYEEIGDVFSAISEYQNYLTANPFGPDADAAKKALTELDSSQIKESDN